MWAEGRGGDSPVCGEGRSNNVLGQVLGELCVTLLGLCGVGNTYSIHSYSLSNIVAYIELWSRVHYPDQSMPQYKTIQTILLI